MLLLLLILVLLYTGKVSKIAEYGGFSHDDTNVMMLVYNPEMNAKMVNSPVETMQIAPTILAELGLNTGELRAVQKEHD